MTTVFAQARKNMVDSQLATSGITDPRVLDAFTTVPREMFLPPDRKGAAYRDEDLLLPEGGGTFCMEPLVHARLIQAARPGQQDAVLNIGDATGYSAAILSDMVSTVMTLESRPGILNAARASWDELGFCNIAVLRGKEAEGCPEHAPYDLIVLNGAVGTIPETLLAQLSPHGRLAAVLRPRPDGTGRITVIEKIGENAFSTGYFHDAATPYVPGLEPAETFTF